MLTKQLLQQLNKDASQKGNQDTLPKLKQQAINNNNVNGNTNTNSQATNGLAAKLNTQPSQKEQNQQASDTKRQMQATQSKKPVFNYIEEKVIGQGTFGVVYFAQVKESGETVAIKKVYQDKRYKNRELQIMKELGEHPNVIKLRHFFYTYGKDQDEVFLNLIMDYIPETLYRIIKYYKKKKIQFPNVLIKMYAYQLLRSLAYIHGVGICHRDIKPTNVLIDPRNHMLKLCDFGSAKKLIKGESNIAYICSRYYRAPELMFGATDYNESIDVWSAGCVIAEMMLGEPLFAGEASVDQLIEIIKILGTPSKQQIFEMNPSCDQNGFKFPPIKAQQWSNVFKECKADSLAIDLIAKLLTYSPQQRLKPFESLAHPYFDELRIQNCRINNKPLPDLFNFCQEEIGQFGELQSKLVPSWRQIKN